MLDIPEKVFTKRELNNTSENNYQIKIYNKDVIKSINMMAKIHETNFSSILSNLLDFILDEDKKTKIDIFPDAPEILNDQSSQKVWIEYIYSLKTWRDFWRFRDAWRKMQITTEMLQLNERNDEIERYWFKNWTEKIPYSSKRKKV